MNRSKHLSVIDKGLFFTGDITGKGQLVVKGEISGTLKADSVIIAEEGKALCDATVHSMTVGGVYEGTLKAEKELIVLKGGCCSGTVSCGDLIVEAGGVINASVTCTKNEKGKESPKSVTETPKPLKLAKS
ncbi:polymer-forming cytoskeletal protein [Desulfoluna sp.]|uniref:bactofilin family protein n=1 Tax=Desulfoluna sp. TaxID=2045199 RepID=UPI002621EE5E|nr:polymer-forming cytoskeletal protein [Desulfoluna sp.]